MAGRHNFNSSLFRNCPIDLISARIDLRFFIHSSEPLCFTPLYPAADDQSILCCYFITTGTFLSHLSTFLRYSPLAVPQYATYESGFFDICCISRLTCRDYYVVRPQVALNTPNSVAFSGGFGDPHFTTFDGFEYTFNGIGKFCCITVLLPLNTCVNITIYDTYRIYSNSSPSPPPLE